MTRILHTADTHLGYSQYHSETRSKDFAAAFQTIIDEAVERDVDAVVHSGDLFHHSRPDVDTLATTLGQLQRLDDAEIPFLGIVGNHEGTSGEQWVDIFGQLELGIRLGSTPTVIGDTAFYGLDHVSPARRSSLDYEFEEHDADCAVLVGHGLFSPVAERGQWNLIEIMDAANIKFDGYLLGDDHMPHVQTVREATVTYPGSTDRTASDQQAPRGFNIILTGDEADSPSINTDTEDPAPVGISADVSVPNSTDGWPSNITSAREVGVERATEGPHGDPPILVERHEMKTRPFRYISVSMDEGDGMGRVRNEIDRVDLGGAVGIVHLTGEGDPVLEAPLEEYVREAGAMIARVTDTRAFGTDENTDDISFADPEAAVNRQLQDMELSAAGYDVEEEIRNQGIATTSMADDIQDEVKERIDGDEDDFLPIEDDDEAPSYPTDTGADTAAEDDAEAAGDEEVSPEGETDEEVENGNEGGETGGESDDGEPESVDESVDLEEDVEQKDSAETEQTEDGETSAADHGSSDEPAGDENGDEEESPPESDEGDGSDDGESVDDEETDEETTSEENKQVTLSEQWG